MDIYEFFNSPDVAEYCKSIGHALNAIEAAVMVNECNFKSVLEKHTAYAGIIADYPDMELERNAHYGHIKSFHKALAGMIAYEERELESYLRSETGCVYQAAVYFKAPCGYDSYELGLFTSYEKALANALEHCRIEEDFTKNPPYQGWEVTTVLFIEIRKKHLDVGLHGQCGVAKVSLSGEILEVYSGDNLTEQEGDFINLLQSIYIDIPVPFKRGDLLEMDVRLTSGSMGEVFVLESTSRDDAEKNAKMLYRADTSDMAAGVHYVADGNVKWDMVHFYPNLRYCRREPKGEAKILKYISYHMKDKLCLCGLLNMHKYLALKAEIELLADDYDLQYQLDELSESLPEHESSGGNP